MLRPPWSEVASIYRSVCRLRFQSREAEAELILGGEFAAALLAAREKGPAPTSEAQLQAALDAEEDRVSNALATAELLAPLLNAAPAVGATIPSRRAASPVLAGARSAQGEVPSVADFIEDMLTQERARRS